jgi:hypothetical protein
MKAERRQRTCPGLVLEKTTVIVLVIRSRPVYDNCHLLLKDKGETMKAESGKRVARSRLPAF